MRATISKEFNFDAAHRLVMQAREHKCHRLHGHTYRVEIHVRGEPGRRQGMVIDYAELTEAWNGLHQKLDHRTLLNTADPLVDVLADVTPESVVTFPFETTTENLAAWIYQELKDYEVEVREERDGVESVMWKSVGGLGLGVRVYESSTTYAEVGEA